MEHERRTARPPDGRADALGDQFVVGAAEDEGGHVVRSARGGPCDRGVDRGVVRVVHRVREPGARHLGDGHAVGELLDQTALVRAARGYKRQPPA